MGEDIYNLRGAVWGLIEKGDASELAIKTEKKDKDLLVGMIFTLGNQGSEITRITSLVAPVGGGQIEFGIWGIIGCTGVFKLIGTYRSKPGENFAIVFPVVKRSDYPMGTFIVARKYNPQKEKFLSYSNADFTSDVIEESSAIILGGAHAESDDFNNVGFGFTDSDPNLDYFLDITFTI
jgi:hypothetical protein